MLLNRFDNRTGEGIVTGVGHVNLVIADALRQPGLVHDTIQLVDRYVAGCHYLHGCGVVTVDDLGRAASTSEPAQLALRGRSSDFITDTRRIYTGLAGLLSGIL